MERCTPAIQIGGRERGNCGGSGVTERLPKSPTAWARQMELNSAQTVAHCMSTKACSEMCGLLKFPNQANCPTSDWSNSFPIMALTECGVTSTATCTSPATAKG